MTIDKNKLIELIEFGSDIEFEYMGKLYTILPWTDEGISVGEQNSDEDFVYKNCDDFIQNYKTDDMPILSILQDINVVYHN